jgi:sugar lactone lactonase YvrE
MRSTESRVWAELGDFYLGEGPQVVSVEGSPDLVWVNIQTGDDAKAGVVHRHPLAGGLDRHFDAPGRPGFLRAVAGTNRVLVGVEKSLRTLDLVSGEWSGPLAALPDASDLTIMNDGTVLPDGKSLVFGTKDTKFKEPLAHLYLYTTDDRRLSVLASHQTCSNWKVIASDPRGLIQYDIDTPTRKVARYRLDVAARTASPDGTAVDLSHQTGFPDGMCDCGDGTAIIALYNPNFAEAGRAVRCDLSTGEEVEEWTTPGSPRVTCPVLVKLGGGVKLVLTTATEGMPADTRAKCPNAGRLFVADTQLADCPAPGVVRLPS